MGDALKRFSRPAVQLYKLSCKTRKEILKVNASKFFFMAPRTEAQNISESGSLKLLYFALK